VNDPSFVARHIGPDAGQTARMLEVVGYDSLEALVAAAVPESIQLHERLALPPAAGEPEVLAELTALAQRNVRTTSMIGLGYSDTVTPAVIRRNVIENPGWYTAYTPYQPEISQGRLEVLLAFQTMVEDLTGLPVAGASLLDEPTAAAEAMALAVRTGKNSRRYLVDADTHPQTIAVMQTRAVPMGIDLVIETIDDVEALPAGDFAGALLSYPGTSGAVRDLTAVTDALKARGVQVAVAADLLSLTLLKPPGEWGADVVVGSAQRFGVPMGFGGPHAGFMSVRTGLERQLPGRLVGVSVD
jgi:glycine dehydrogenase